ncbi:MAG: hypothetical protein MIO93_03305 [ANME-2 cluster archaeon]|nr:hypothetical protein [ANME-2 cluster archaeon]
MVAKYLEYDCLYVTDNSAVATFEAILDSDEAVESTKHHASGTHQQRAEFFNKITGSR